MAALRSCGLIDFALPRVLVRFVRVPNKQRTRTLTAGNERPREKSRSAPFHCVIVRHADHHVAAPDVAHRAGETSNPSPTTGRRHRPERAT
jgi:hypothetical protein